MAHNQTTPSKRQGPLGLLFIGAVHRLLQRGRAPGEKQQSQQVRGGG